MHFKLFGLVRDKDGMVRKGYHILEVTTYNSGVDEFGNSVGYGYSETKEYEVATGDVFYENYGDELLQNPDKKTASESMGKMFSIKKLGEDKVTIQVDGEVREVEYGKKECMYSFMQLLDNASTSYNLEFFKH